MRLPKVPVVFLPDFVRGYFDGDGGVSYGEYGRGNRPGKVRSILARFTSESAGFLRKLRKVLERRAGMGKGSLISYGTYACLSYSLSDSLCLFRFLYGKGMNLKRPFLNRKYQKFLKGLRFCSKGAVV